MLNTTTVSLSDAPVTTTITNSLYPSHLRHALIVNLQDSSKSTSDSQLPTLLKNLQNIESETIDMIQFLDGTPSLTVWKALSHLKNVSHLEMISGYDEYCNIEPLDEVGSLWPLKSLLINSACGESINTIHLQSIHSFKLIYCCGLSFPLSTRDNPSQLKELTIIENDACDHFIKFQEETSLINHLSKLTIQSTNGCDFTHQYEEESFGKALIECHLIISLELTLNDTSNNESSDHRYLIELPDYFPLNVEVLRFRGPPTLANDLSIWRKCALDPKWLPNLKSIQFSLDVHRPNETIPDDQAKLAQEQSKEFLKELKSFRPTLTILNEVEQNSPPSEIK